MFKGWVELFDRFIESMSKRNGDRELATFQIARHACGMVIFLLFINGVMVFQTVVSAIDYMRLKEDYTELSLNYLEHSKAFLDMNGRFKRLEARAGSLNKERDTLNGKVGALYEENKQLMVELGLCLNPKAKQK